MKRGLRLTLGLLAVLVLAVLVAARLAGPSWQTEDAFVAEMLERLRARPEVTRVELDGRDPLLLTVSFTEGRDSRRVYLGNLKAALRDAPVSDRDRQVEHFVQFSVAVVDDPPTWAEAEPLLRPVIRDGSYLPRDAVAREEFLPALSVHLAVEHPDRFAYVTGSHLTSWQVAPEQAHEAAYRNLEHADPRHIARLRGKLWQLTDADPVGSSRLLVQSWRDAATERVGARLVYAIPDHARLLFAPADDPGALQALHAAAAIEYREAVRPISPDLYAEDTTHQLAPLALPGDHPLHAALMRTRDAFMQGR